MVVRSTNGTQTTTCPSTRKGMFGANPSLWMKISAAKPKASAGSSSGDMNRTSQARAKAERLRAMPSAAAVPSTTETTVVQNATTRLFQAAACNLVRVEQGDIPAQRQAFGRKFQRLRGGE